MSILSPLSLVATHPWRRAVFTTYALSLSFFEAVLLDALVRGGAREALILADVEGIRMALSEQGARRVGKDYDVEPLAVRGGVFHPKISVLTADDECHLLVGSGNLTFGGWGGNFENIEHLHPSAVRDPIGLHLTMLEQVRRQAGEFDLMHFHLDYYPFSLFSRQPTPFVTTCMVASIFLNYSRYLPHLHRCRSSQFRTRSGARYRRPTGSRQSTTGYLRSYSRLNL
jgi:hypothetical protein